MPSLQDYRTDQFYIDVKQEGFVEKFEQASEVFQAKIPREIHRGKLFTYIALLLDPKSELRKSISTLPQRKFVAAITAGFVLNPEKNKFNEEIEKALAGGNPEVNRMCAEYCFLVGGTDYLVYTTYSRILMEVTAMSQEGKAYKDNIAIIGKVHEEINKLEGKLFGGDEVSDMRKALYLSSKQVKLNLQMEDIVDRLANGDDLSEFNPYPENYKPNKLKYAGESEPDEQVS
jgi:hypothetical protein